MMVRKRTACASLAVCMKALVLPFSLILSPAWFESFSDSSVKGMFVQCRTMTGRKMMTRRRTACVSLQMPRAC